MRKVFALTMFAVLACGGGAKAGALGMVKIEPGQPIEIRAVLSDSVVPSVSRVLRTAIGIAIDDFGPVRGHRVTVETLDEMCSPEGGRAAGEAVVAEAQVVGVIGTLCSAGAVATSPVLSAAGLSMISPANTSPVLTSDLAGNEGPDHHEGYYRVIGNDLIKGSVVARFSYDELGLRTMVTIHDGDPFTSALANAFAEAFRERGGTVPVVAQVSKGQTDMAAVLARFSGAGPDGVFIPLFSAEAAALIRQADKLESLGGVTRIGGAALMTTEILALPESEGFYFAAHHLGDRGNTNQATGRSAADVLSAFEGGPRRATDVGLLGAWLRRHDAAAVRDRGGIGLGRRYAARRPQGATRSIGAHRRIQGAGRHADLRRLRGLRHGPQRDPFP